MVISIGKWNMQKRELKRLCKTLLTTGLACAILISMDVIFMVKFIERMLIVFIIILEIITVLSIFGLLLISAILKRRDVLCAYMIMALVHSHFRVMIAATAIIVVAHPQTYILAIGHNISRKEAQILWAIICVVSVLVWILELIGIYFAFRYRSYLSRHRYDGLRIQASKVTVAATNTMNTTIQSTEPSQPVPVSFTAKGGNNQMEELVS